MLEVVKHDCCYTTGHNLRKIMLLLNRSNKEKASKDDVKNQTYNDIASDQVWKVCLAKELIEIKNNVLEIECLNLAKIDEISKHFDLTLLTFTYSYIKPLCLK